MRARGIGRAFRLAALSLAGASVVAAGGSVAAPARAGEQPCHDGAPATGVAPEQASLPCADTVPPPTVTETVPVEEPPAETEGDPPAAPPPVDTTTSPAPPPTRRSPRPATTASPPAPPAPSPPSTSGTFAASPTSATPKLAGGPYVFPVIGATSFSDTWGAPRATVAWHHGVDIFAPPGSPIVAVADGTLFSVGWNVIGGQRLWLRDRAGNYFYYAHLSAFSPVAVDGARVRAGTVLGYVGDTGDAAGTPHHLHFEIHPASLLSLGYDGAVNPFPYVSTWRRLDLTGGGEAATSGAAPAPGAILLGYTDISNASGLSPEAREQTLQGPAVVAAVAYEPGQPAPSTWSRETIPPPREEAARIARSLDSEASRPTRYGASVWDGLAVCESGGDWGANTGNGYIGGLQFHPQTWASHGGSAFARSAHRATREQQIAIAKRVLASQGWGAWPACSAMLGLRALASE